MVPTVTQGVGDVFDDHTCAGPGRSAVRRADTRVLVAVAIGVVAECNQAVIAAASAAWEPLRCPI